MGYLDIFDEVVDIMKNDYSGFETKSDWGDDSRYRRFILNEIEKGTITRKKFKKYVDEYLLDFRDNHVRFVDKTKAAGRVDFGIKFRRFEDKLYITEADEKTGLKVGMVVSKIDGKSIPELSEKWNKHLQYQCNERQEWERILENFSSITVSDEVETYEYKLEEIEGKPYNTKYSLDVIDDKTVMLTFTDFFSMKKMNSFIEENHEKIMEAENLIIDVRYNRGGSDDVYHGILQYYFKENTIFDDIPCMANLKCYFNLSERNYKLRVKYLEGLDKANRESEFAKKLMSFMNENRGNKMALWGADSKEKTFVGIKEPKKTIIMTDRYCGSSGDIFVLQSKDSPYTKVIGRNTIGVIDYSNQGVMDFEDNFTLRYSTSILSTVLEGKGIDNVGVDVEVHIPWTPEHLERDVDLEKALEILRA